ncbi:hypothetical protein NGB36_02155 [Streptomyces sp. RB6PN25]|uniref:Uncharacterized protein n=1 Tax=Streptomyces humicola TaxID=2953240 RepID=A0ABT1PQM6_9ACTN|nr:hypothetical protein [Streptomyces humicola]MCQ4079433.1 hypothetical protein [Streptomyces humicola]
MFGGAGQADAEFPGKPCGGVRPRQSSEHGGPGRAEQVGQRGARLGLGLGLGGDERQRVSAG